MQTLQLRFDRMRIRIMTLEMKETYPSYEPRPRVPKGL